MTHLINKSHLIKTSIRDERRRANEKILARLAAGEEAKVAAGDFGLDVITIRGLLLRQKKKGFEFVLAKVSAEREPRSNSAAPSKEPDDLEGI